jgi:hypothetical protein
MDRGCRLLKIPCLSFLALVIALGLGISITHAGTFHYTIEAGSYEIVELEDGDQEIHMQGFGQLLDPGKPKLPSKIFCIAIPPGVRADSIRIAGNTLTELPGTYDITPAPMVSPLDATEAEVDANRAVYQNIVETAYASDTAYPDREGVAITQGAYRKYNLVQVRFSPFQYKARSGKLLYYPSATVTVDYTTASALTNDEGLDAAPPGLIADWLPEVEEQASEILENYDEAAGWYPPPEQGDVTDQIGLYEFVIVTTDALVDAVQPLVDWEKSKGRSVYVATTSWINANYTGADLQRRIRYFLRAKYPSSEWGITNVCLVGDLNDVPMRYTSPGGAGTSTVPTDLYYAELTDMDSLSWDDDWDGYFGEYGQDSIDFVQEVHVGRIPWSDPALVEDICLKIAEFGYSNTMAGYKDNVLFNMAYFWWDTDGAVLSEYLLAEGQFDSFVPYRIYERSVYHPGYTDNRWSSYWANDYMDAAGSPFVDRWTSSTNYGFVNWLGHGNSASAAYHCGDGLSCWNFIHRDDCTSLNDSYPAIVYSDSCSTAYPDVNSLGRNVMKQGGVAFVGASRVAYGAHGWDHPSDGNCESLHYEFARRAAWYNRTYTVGSAFRYALWTMYNTWNWGASWYQMFEWTLFGNPDMRSLAPRPSLPNLDRFNRTGWDYPIVPRSSDGATGSWCPVTGTLPGNSSDTYFNWTWENNGAIHAPQHRTRVFVDNNWIFYSDPSVGAGASIYYANLQTGPSVKGGRHTLHYDIDENDQVWENSETDNCWGRQFVWSPYGLADNLPVTRSAATYHTAWGCSGSPNYYNNDGFSFYVGNVHPNKWWSAVGVLPSNINADYDLRLWDIGNYTGSEGGFGGGYLEWSSWGPGASDFVIVNDNTSSAGTYYAGAINYNDQTGNFRIEEATSTKIYDGTNGPYSMGTATVLDIYEYLVSAGEYGIKLEQTAGSCDLGISLYDNETMHAAKSEYMSGGMANANGDGGDEFMQVTIPNAGYHGLVVWKADAGDYNKASTYRIKAGKCATPSTPAAPYPADGATDVSVNVDLNWGDCTDTEYYKVWLREDYGTWVHLGDTETSAWVLPTLKESTHYDWYITAWNICGDYSNVYWEFTTEDNTAPTPNPMIWTTIPYELNTTQIRMKAATASDPNPPINYFFDCTGSPTGGGGGTDSGWQIDTLYTDSGLEANHQYGYRVKAKDASANETAYCAVSYDYTDIQTPSGITFGTITTSSIQAKSANTPSGLTRGSSGLYVQNVTNGTGSAWKQNNAFWTSGSLATNTLYSFRAQAKNGDGDPTPWSPTSSRYTLANVPGASVFSDITQTSIRANWTANGNPSGTQYYCQNQTAGTNSGWIDSTSWNSTGLDCGKAHSFRVRSRNGDGVTTDWTALGSATTDSCAEPCECDLNGDGSCNGPDWLMFYPDWGRTDCNDPGVVCECDLNGDGSCNGPDWLMFYPDWGRTDCPIP